MPSSARSYIETSLSSILMLLNSSLHEQNSSIRYEFYNVTQVIKPKKARMLGLLLECRAKRRCFFDVSRKMFGDPYPEKITQLQISIKYSCQPGDVIEF